MIRASGEVRREDVLLSRDDPLQRGVGCIEPRDGELVAAGPAQVEARARSQIDGHELVLERIAHDPQQLLDRIVDGPVLREEPADLLEPEDLLLAAAQLLADAGRRDRVAQCSIEHRRVGLALDEEVGCPGLHREHVGRSIALSGQHDQRCHAAGRGRVANELHP